jgi:hypothetical protein
MILWLWDACGPARSGRGVTDDQARALQLAETLLRSGQANVARVEGARLVPGTHTLNTGYERTGEGWRGRCGDSGVRWEPFTSALKQAAS